MLESALVSAMLALSVPPGNPSLDSGMLYRGSDVVVLGQVTGEESIAAAISAGFGREVGEKWDFGTPAKNLAQAKISVFYAYPPVKTI